MIASAPGKLVLSGAYVVLDGAPAVVAAVGRYSVADTSRRPRFVSPELRAAFGDRPAPAVDSSSMRSRGRKLGLGSSAACVVAALAATRAPPASDPLAPLPALETAMLDAIERDAYAAHRAAQGGGSGIDVVASTRGGIVVCTTREGAPPDHRRSDMPAGLVLEAWLCPESGSTPSLLGPVRALRRDAPARYAAITAPALEGARAFAAGIDEGDARLVLEGASLQRHAMADLGEASGSPILPPYLLALGPFAEREAAVFAQAGAGGGDIAIFFGRAPSTRRFRREATSRGLRLVALSFGAPGVHPGPPAPAFSRRRA